MENNFAMQSKKETKTDSMSDNKENGVDERWSLGSESVAPDHACEKDQVPECGVDA